MGFRFVAAMLAVIGVSVLASCVPGARAQGALVEITRAELDAALAATLAQGPEVGFPERIRFGALDFTHAAGLGVAGRARFLEAAARGDAAPETAFFGTIPMTWWRVEQGALIVRLASVEGIDPVPGGAMPGSREADAIRDSLGTGIGDLLSRMAFPTGLDPNRRWIVRSAGSTPEALWFELHPG